MPASLLYHSDDVLSAVPEAWSIHHRDLQDYNPDTMTWHQGLPVQFVLFSASAVQLVLATENCYKQYPFQYWLDRDCEYLICTPDDKHFLYRNYYDSYWTPLMEELKLQHRPHDTRHTCVSLLTEAGVDERIIKKIVGHKGQGVTETVYTHLELPIKLEAINKI